MKSYYHSLFSEISQRSVDATLGVLGIKNTQLRAHIKTQMTDELAQGNRILADPVFEAAFPWAEVSKTFGDLGNSDFLHPSFVDALDAEHKNVKYYGGKEDKDLSEQALKRSWKPRTHQLRSWEILKEVKPKSLIVTSGTGSGKTECFMIPIIDDLVRQHIISQQKLEGVQALFIYPLNALINSQRERILSWTLNFEDNVRFCLYNGNTEKKRNTAPVINGNPKNEVYDRPHLWESPPPILITNPTMLEYMMIRSQDRPILDASQGKLKYIVLDEAHTYIGSQAAELALLIRRVLNGFGVEAENVRFIATSATIGNDQESENALKKYLADIAGIDEDIIEVVGGKRTIPALVGHQLNELSFEDLDNLEVEENLDSFYQNKTLRILRSYFINHDNQQSKARKLTQITDLLFPSHSENIEAQKNTLKWIDLASNEKIQKNRVHFLPLRGHFFHKVLNGLWACVDSICACKNGTALKNEWSFGKVFSQQRLTCECGAPVYELVFCDECNEPHLIGEMIHENGTRRLSQVRRNDLNEFELNQEQSENTEDDSQNIPENNRVLMYFRAADGTVDSRLNREGVLGIDSNSYPLRIHYNEHNETCFNCGLKGEGQKESMRGAYLGMPFYISGLVPSLLEHVKDGDNPLLQPYRGRRILTFTDSRQGTAKIAIKIQQESERIRTRGLILKALLTGDNDVVIENKKAQITDLEKIPTKSPVILELIEQLKFELTQLILSTKSYPEELIFLQQEPDVFQHIKDSYENLDYRFKDNLSKLAYLLLLREFNRRPKRVNSLETFGLVATAYPQLNLIQKIPTEFTEKGLTLNEWKDFLKVSIDFFIRDRVYISIEDNNDFIKWLGARFSSKFLLAPNSLEEQTTVYRKWPAYDNKKGIRQNRLVRILAHGLDIDLETINQEQKDVLNSLLEKAWSSLVSIQILKFIGGGFRMKFSDISFSLMNKAFICPLTQKFLDTTFRGFTPYLPLGARLREYYCEEVNMPSYPRIIANDENDYRLQMRQWINSDPIISELKRRGFWSEPASKILEGGNYIRTAEHSAQQSMQKLQRYESQFKKGYINVLSCSTTMEMGVDIGGLSIVCNNNVPPHPSNYLQRAGRAGRRGESRALSITLCKNNPHDQQVFQNPLWAFEAKMKQPKITLSSERIVRRHLQAFLFSWFLNNELENLDQNQITLRAEWFFEGDPNICSQFEIWLENLTYSCPKGLERGLDYIKRKSVLEGINLNDVLIPAKDLLSALQQKWKDQLGYYTKELDAIPNPKKPNFPQYLRRVQADLAAHRGTYLLSILITGGFLPGYGFPTNISTFNNYTIDDFFQSRRDEENNQRDDNRNIIAGKPTRNMAIALTEYAPGSQIVLDGKVFTSRGVTLNFQNPDDNVINHQVIHKAWRCWSCGKSGLSHYGNINTCNNPQCTNPRKIEFFDYLEPSGFATSFYDSPTNDISSQNFVPAQVPWINTGTDLQHLINPNIGSFISDEAGEIFYHNKGRNGNGFALCFNCGYADSDGSIPKNFHNHFKLRGKNSAAGDKARCNPNANQIRGGISLGFADKTDVFELYLKHQDTAEYFLVSNEENKKLSWTLGVALRHGLAKTLGVNAEELGVTVKQVVNKRMSNTPIYSICLFDTNSGGSGFASLASQPHIFKFMLQNALELLGCQNCQNACQNCLLQFDTKQYAELLDRRLGLNYLTQSLINSLGLPEEEKILGPNSVFCRFDIWKDIKLNSTGKGDKIQLIVNGEEADWAISESTIRKRISELVGIHGKFIQFELWMEHNSYKNLTVDQKFDLYYLLAADNEVELMLTDKFNFKPEVTLLATTWKNGIPTSYASKEPSSIQFNEFWGETSEAILVKAQIDLQLQGNIVSKKDLIPFQQGNVFQIQLVQELNTQINDFGNVFWNLIKSHLIEKGYNIESFGILKLIDYSDRYLASPLTVILLANILKAVPFKLCEGFGAVLTTLISKADLGYGERNITRNWCKDEDYSKEDLIRGLLNPWDNIDVNFADHANKMPHSRELMLEFENGKSINIRLDQGVGYWKVNRNPMFPFEETIEKQLEWIQRNSKVLNTMNSQRHPTYIDIKVE